MLNIRFERVGVVVKRRCWNMESYHLENTQIIGKIDVDCSRRRDELFQSFFH